MANLKERPWHIQTSHSEACKHSKRKRLATAAFVRKAIQSHTASAVIIALPDAQPARRDTYTTINSTAYALLGAHNYSLTAPIIDRCALLSWTRADG